MVANRCRAKRHLVLSQVLRGDVETPCPLLFITPSVRRSVRLVWETSLRWEPVALCEWRA